MIYPRLKLARNLLANDGAIFISIDDNEFPNLHKLCCEIFGESNFIGNIIWRKKYGIQNDAKYFSTSHEYIVCFAKDASFFKPNLSDRSEEQNNRYKNPDNDPRGPWMSDNLSVGRVTPKDIYEIVTPSGRKVLPPSGSSWRISKDKFDSFVTDNRIWFGDDGGNTPRLKRFLSEVKQGITPTTFWDYEEVGHTDGANKALKALFDGKQYFDYPKPVSLIKKILSIGANRNDIVLDFFSGSATLAEAVFELNVEKNLDLKFICVQIPELCNSDSIAYKDGYLSICDVAKQRIIRSANKLNANASSQFDFGFRVFSLDDSSMQDIFYRPDDYDQSEIEIFSDSVKPDRSDLDLLSQILLDWGLPLDLKIDKFHLLGKNLYKISDSSLVACFDHGVDEELAKNIAKERPLRVVFKDSGFKDDTAKSNVRQLLKQLSPETEMKVL
jgi:adenine-specific DNA-methyltransferase